ncbi:MAG: hypothetical protein ACLSCF_11530 [Alistipes finegoldii]
MDIERFVSDAVCRSVEALYGPLEGEPLQIQKTRREFEGDFTLVVFPLLRRSRKGPEATATEIGESRDGRKCRQFKGVQRRQGIS